MTTKHTTKHYPQLTLSRLVPTAILLAANPVGHLPQQAEFDAGFVLAALELHPRVACVHSEVRCNYQIT